MLDRKHTYENYIHLVGVMIYNFEFVLQTAEMNTSIYKTFISIDTAITSELHEKRY